MGVAHSGESCFSKWGVGTSSTQGDFTVSAPKIYRIRACILGDPQVVCMHVKGHEALI